jgi:hypothetical protein
MGVGRDSHTATVLESGEVLVVGGYKGTSFDEDGAETLAGPELFDPEAGAASGAWLAVSDPESHFHRTGHSAVLLVSCHAKEHIILVLLDSIVVDGGAVAGEPFEDLLCRLVPDEGLWVLVPGGSPGLDVVSEGLDTAVSGALELLGGESAEPPLQ